MPKTFTILEKRLKLHHQTRNPSEDALWLAKSFTPNQKDNVLDAGCGCGVIGLALLTLHPELNLKITGIDISPEEISQAKANAKLNSQEKNYTAQQADFTNLTKLKTQFNHVAANLPFHAQTRGHTTPNQAKATAHTLPPNILQTWLNSFLTTLKPQGQLHILLHAKETQEIINFTTKNHLTQTHNFIVTKKNTPPKRVIFHIIKT